jgi:hypothetical protein
MLKLLIDTCVWLDLAKDHRQQVTLRYIEQLMEAGEIALVVPIQVVNEFTRNRDRIIKENQQSLSSVFKRVKDTIRRFGDEERRNNVLEQLDDVDHRLSTLSEAVIDSIEHIERLFEKVTPAEITDAVKLRATDRAMTKRAPFHRNKNSMGDALLIELFMEAVASRAKGEHFIFVTHNTQDFSSPSDLRQPHSDFTEIFAPEYTSYSTNLAEVLKGLAPDLLEEIKFELEFVMVSRSLNEIVAWENRLERQVWYNRHMVRREAIEDGRIRLIPREEFDSKNYDPTTIVDDIWEGALKAAAEVEAELEGDVGPWDDFEWGMVNGKLSALRWVLGDDWDMLDT